MKNTLSILILMVGLLVTMAIGNQVTASVLTDQSHPELVSGPPQVASASPETTISASVSSSIEATVDDPTVPATKGNFFFNN